MRKLALPDGHGMWLPLGLALLLVILVAAGFHLTRATTLTLAVAPNGGTEPALLRAYADELAQRKLGVRLKVVAFGGVRESEEALKTGQATRSEGRTSSSSFTAANPS